MAPFGIIRHFHSHISIHLGEFFPFFSQHQWSIPARSMLMKWRELVERGWGVNF